ncbi:hypothetical protein PRIC1_004379 [Phytophthora ramorum]|uniref:Uncharacterized protein n=1 Tax=Phytophthora ramorum TaxID=164328 RepID=H3G9J4_PHYRM|nr:hypothetical protein KRP23_4134 [Phytophthora ramorum]
MKLSLFVAALVGLTISAVDATVHLRVHILTELAVQGAVCESPSRAAKCGAGLFCQMEDEDNGYCRKKSPALGEICGGKAPDGPWAVTCNSSDLKCVLESETKSTCQKTTDRE